LDILLARQGRSSINLQEISKKYPNQFDVKIKKIRSDNGKEFDDTNIEEYCDEVGIKLEFSSTYTPQQMGL